MGDFIVIQNLKKVFNYKFFKSPEENKTLILKKIDFYD